MQWRKEISHNGDGVGLARLVVHPPELIPGLDVLWVHVGGLVREAGDDGCGEDLQLVRCVLVAWADVGFLDDDLVCQGEPMVVSN